MADPILARQVQAMALMLVGLGLVGLALYLRLRIFIGTRPGGVDTWYYLASAEAIQGIDDFHAIVISQFGVHVLS